jgi:beta-glucosidase
MCPGVRSTSPAWAESQLPINVGDKKYNPLYPYGWGLRTDSAHSRLTSVLKQLRATHKTGAAQQSVRNALAKRNWSGATMRNATAVLASVRQAASTMTGARYTWTEQNLLTSVARDLAQEAIVNHQAMSATAAMTANAEHALLSGNPLRAVNLLIQARTTARNVHGAGPDAMAGRDRVV